MGIGIDVVERALIALTDEGARHFALLGALGRGADVDEHGSGGHPGRGLAVGRG
jgi:hypothetical protein